MTDDDNVIKLPTGYIPTPIDPDADIRQILLQHGQMLGEIRHYMVIQGHAQGAISEELSFLSRTINKLIKILKDKA